MNERDMAGPGWDEEPLPVISDWYESDARYEAECAQQERIDRGDECPDCHGHKEISTTVACGITLFSCACGCDWFDSLTRPTGETA